MKTNEVKKGLVASGLSLLMMMTVMAGTSFAWFNQTIVNQGARIQAGTLQVEFLADADGDFSSGSINLATSSDPVFQFGTNAQPGDTQSKYLRVKNLGTISLDYEVMFRVVLDTGLAEAVVITIDKVVPDEAVVTRYGDDIAGYKLQHTGEGMAQNAVETYLVTMTFDQSAGNEFQGTAFELDMTLIAWQSAQVASKPIVVSSIGELQAAQTSAVKGSTIVVVENITANSTAIAFTQLINLDLRGNTLSLQSFSVTSTNYGFMRFENGQLTVIDYTINTPNATLTHTGGFTLSATNTSITTSQNSYILQGSFSTINLSVLGNTSFKPQAESQLVITGVITKDVNANVIPTSGAFINVPSSEKEKVQSVPGALIVQSVINPGDSIQDEIDAAESGDTIYLSAGTFVETLFIYKPLTLLGPNAFISGNATRQPEAIIKASVDTYYNILVYASDVTIAGIKIERNVSATITSMASSSGHAGIQVSKISTTNAPSNVTIRNNVIDGYFGRANDNFAFGSIRFSNANETQANPDHYFINALIEDNLLSNGGYLYLQGATAVVRRNVISGGRAGIQVQPYSNPNLGGEVYENTIVSYRTGIYYNFANKNSAPWTIRNNTISPTNTKPGGLDSTNWEAIAFETFATVPVTLPVGQTATAKAIITNNTFDGLGIAGGRVARGFEFYNISLDGQYEITGNIFKNLSYALYFDGAKLNFSGNLVTIEAANTIEESVTTFSN